MKTKSTVSRARQRVGALVFRRLAKIPLERFCSFFGVTNRLLFRWPISLKLEVPGNQIRISDRDGLDICIARASRVRLYRNGISNRLDVLESQYFLNEISFDAGDWIIDAGANVGEVTKLLQVKYCVNSLAIEPEDIERNCIFLNTAAQNTVVFSEPLWSTETELDWYEANDTADSSLHASAGAVKVVTRKTSTLDSVLHRAGIEGKEIKLLKLEAEGSEPEILLGANRALQHIKYIAADLGPERGLENEHTVVPVIQILARHGFEPMRFNFLRGTMLFSNKSLNNTQQHGEI